MNKLLRILLIALTMFATTVGPVGLQSVQACPMCKAAVEEDDRQPRAYMYSILFMLGMAATVFGTVTVGLIRLSRREALALTEAGLNS